MFREIAARPEVEKVLVGLHQDWCDYDEQDVAAKRFPPAENVHIFTSASSSDVERWIAGMEADGVIAGWPYGQPGNAPQPASGYAVFSVCWDGYPVRSCAASPALRPTGLPLAGLA